MQADSALTKLAWWWGGYSPPVRAEKVLLITSQKCGSSVTWSNSGILHS